MREIFARLSVGLMSALAGKHSSGGKVSVVMLKTSTCIHCKSKVGKFMVSRYSEPETAFILFQLFTLLCVKQKNYQMKQVLVHKFLIFTSSTLKSSLL